jgi:hypothetical protein
MSLLAYLLQPPETGDSAPKNKNRNKHPGHRTHASSSFLHYRTVMGQPCESFYSDNEANSFTAEPFRGRPCRMLPGWANRLRTKIRIFSDESGHPAKCFPDRLTGYGRAKLLCQTSPQGLPNASRPS